MFELDNSLLLCSRIGGCIREYCRYLQFYTFARIVSSFPQHNVEGLFTLGYVETPIRCIHPRGHTHTNRDLGLLTDQSVSVPAAKSTIC